MMGVACPSPGMGTFHLTFFVSLHSIGGLPPGATPVPSGPRNEGQSPSIFSTAGADVIRMAAQSRTAWPATRSRLPFPRYRPVPVPMGPPSELKNSQPAERLLTRLHERNECIHVGYLKKVAYPGLSHDDH